MTNGEAGACRLRHPRNPMMSKAGPGPYDSKELFTIKEVAAIFKVTVRTIWRWIDNGEIKVHNIVGVARIPGLEINRLLGF
jgi:excisionase family DNA binding protein